MADSITLRTESRNFSTCPAGTYNAVCVDVIDLGTAVTEWQGVAKEQAKLVLVYQVDEINPDTKKRFEPNLELTASMSDRANLRKWLESWRGKTYSDEEAAAGVPVHKLVGAPCLLTIEHVPTRKGRTYAKPKTISPLMKGVEKLVPVEYHRSKHWEDRKAEYARDLADFRAKQQKEAANFEQFPEALKDDDTDDLPF